MFNDVEQLPLQLRTVQLVVGTAAERQSSFDKLPQGQAIKRLRSDPRLRIKLVGNLQPAAFNQAMQDFWFAQIDNLLRNAQPLDGLVWMRDDVVLEDFLLVERLAEAWARTDSVVLRGPDGAVLFWALSAAGIRRWAGHFQSAGASQPTAVELQAAWTASAQGSIKLSEKFPAPQVHHAESVGVRGLAWALGMSVVARAEPTPQSPAGGSLQIHPLIAHANLWAAVPPVRVVCATRETQERFLTHTLTGQSLQRIKQAGANIRISVICANETGLSTVYNRQIHQDNADTILLFMHDDVWINDLWLPHRLHEGLLRYDVLGVAGSRQRVPNQPAWPFARRSGEWDRPENLLGQVSHCTDAERSDHLNAKVSRYGTARRGPARLLDGVLLAARCDVLLRSGARFDERFRFHFYDMDFCRTAERSGLRMGVWPMAITHGSGGHFAGADWLATYGSYVGKWQD